jgi:PAS domain S-box-containing protein
VVTVLGQAKMSGDSNTSGSAERWKAGSAGREEGGWLTLSTAPDSSQVSAQASPSRAAAAAVGSQASTSEAGWDARWLGRRVAAESVMIVEAGISVARELQSKLLKLGYDVVGVAEHGDQAVRLARGCSPSVALVNVGLRGTVDGHDVVHLIGNRLGIPVIFLIDSVHEQVIRRRAGSASYGYLPASAGPKELYVAIEIALYKAMLERQLREADCWFTTAMQCVGDGLLATDEDARIRLMNPVAEMLTGWTLEEALGRRVEEVVAFPSAGRADVLECVARGAIAEDRVIGFLRGRTVRSRSGRETKVDEAAAPFHDVRARRSGAVVMLRSVAHRNDHAHFLQARLEAFSNEFESVPWGMALLSLDGAILQVNDTLCRMLGYRAEELIGQSHRHLTHPSDRNTESRVFSELLSGKQSTSHYEQRYLCRDRINDKWADVDVIVLSESRDPVCFLVCLGDHLQRNKVGAD